MSSRYDCERVPFAIDAILAMMMQVEDRLEPLIQVSRAVQRTVDKITRDKVARELYEIHVEAWGTRKP